MNDPAEVLNKYLKNHDIDGILLDVPEPSKKEYTTWKYIVSHNSDQSVFGIVEDSEYWYNALKWGVV